MATAVMLGPADHGRPMARDEFESAQGLEGYRYELIEGKVYVSPAPNLPHEWIGKWLYDRLNDYSREHPEVINFVSGKARVYVPGQEALTSPEPDLAAYHDLPLHLPIYKLAWRDVSPVLVAEILSEDNPEKDLERNVDLYLQVPSIREYWVFDPRIDPDRPTLRVYRRRGDRWQRPIVIAPGELYTTKLLPGFTLLLDPHG
jgi:Uma2 family endonuclease